MPAAESTIVFLPRFTTLKGESAPYSFHTQPLDVSQFASAQFQVFRGPAITPSDVTQMLLYLEESLDCENWVLGASAPKAIAVKPLKTKLFSYGFRLRWFRLRIELTSDDPAPLLVTCWAEGILR